MPCGSFLKISQNYRWRNFVTYIMILPIIGEEDN